ncbi:MULTISPECIES: hypothetical protein [Actinomadura]|uniref:Uncharacterized protein n=1 Tax=Actinomadura yumaensis TaxID=111807 RepID=A0ABW2CXG6_9ACTN|nr:hypothetical protein [Actinomadura sp. J1-007]MWK39605.1 hypothetical protein [Actinomadura sp. J1-007]
MTERQSDHAIRGRIGAIESWAGLTPAERARRTEAGRNGLLAKFAEQADPEGRLSEADRMKAAEALRRAHMLRISRKSVAARKSRAENTTSRK